ncbi:IMP dehydrogenase / GMP reductase domain [seawater metagenome]|uniref:IMP dehydrogenase / GMP reductase domain n=1 Tax=seawater metagenome TaxID=1561972 RepID=A0A5E8CLI0_9ZZZZ
MEQIKIYYSYNDILIKPRLSIVKSRREIDLNTKLTKKLNLKIPIISANMDTVTEGEMAISMAKLGGIGIIHRYCNIQDQVNMVDKVKKNTNFFIKDPICINQNKSVEEYLNLVNRYGKKTIIIVDQNRKFKGIVNKYNITVYEAIKKNKGEDITKKTMKEIMSDSKHYKVLAIDELNSQNFNQDSSKLIKKMKEYNVNYLPVVNNYNDLEIKGLVTLKDLLFYSDQLDKANLDQEGNLCVGAAIGVNGDYLERAKKLIEVKCDVLVIDIAHGHSILVPPIIKELKTLYPDVQIIAGNVATKEGVKFLAEAGADGIKVNIGAGSICTTRIMTGCGIPQFSAVLECANEAKKYGVPIIADGGHSGMIGNMTKALSAGGACCMLGRMLAGTKQSPGKILIKDGKKVKVIRGMAGYISNIQKKRKIDQVDKVEIDNFTPEGVEGYIDYRGSVDDIIEQMLGGIRSGLSYCGVKSIQELHNNPVEYIYMTESGKKESGNHGIRPL